MIIALDSSPLSLITQRVGVADADACRAWVNAMVAAGATVVVPAIADYEVRREPLRAGKTQGVARLDALRNDPAIRYLPMTDAALHHAATLWASVRRAGLPTADPAALDGDVILIAILQTANLPHDTITIATSNPGHLARFVPAETWQNIRP
jgi:hypothetical protein